MSKDNLNLTGWQKLGLVCLLLVGLVGYELLAPRLNRSLDLELPSLLAADEGEELAESRPPTPRSNTEEKPSSSERTPKTDESERSLGELQDIGRGRQRSTAGLIYGYGGAEGTRLAHVMRHSRDIPDRPGRHGVFEGDQAKMLALIDEAYLLAQEGGRRVRTKRDDGRTIHTVDMQRRVGYVGGQVGGRNGNPPATHIRLVLEQQDVITAYPLNP